MSDELIANGITAKVIGILAQYVSPEALTGDPDATELLSLGIASADMINVIIAVEDTFDLDVPDEYVHRLRTVGDIIRAVERESTKA